jgi:hypothetical protein
VDRSGALRIAAFVLVTGVACWIFATHHVPRPATEFGQLILAIEESLFFATFVWLAYIAIEPIMRRRAPELLFSWSRVLAGRFRDPLVGRDVLAGILGSAAMALLAEAPAVLAHWTPLSGMTPLEPSRDFLLGPGPAIGRILRELSHGPLDALGFMTLFSFGLVVLRRRWLAVGLLGLVVTLLSAVGSSENYVALLPAAIATAAVFVWVAIRSGVLAVTVILVVFPLLVTAPFTLNLSRWYAARGFLIVTAIAASAIWAFWTSLGGRRALGALKLGDA